MLQTVPLIYCSWVESHSGGFYGTAHWEKGVFPRMS